MANKEPAKTLGSIEIVTLNNRFSAAPRHNPAYPLKWSKHREPQWMETKTWPFTLPSPYGVLKGQDRNSNQGDEGSDMGGANIGKWIDINDCYRDMFRAHCPPVMACKRPGNA